ncbi:hypothetical protein I4U23_005603 [Adineta vaga]|nr:hypothetical protein I4U23_005603 [Adineta vaga]
MSQTVFVQQINCLYIVCNLRICTVIIIIMASSEHHRPSGSERFVANTTKLEWTKTGREAVMFSFVNSTVIKSISKDLMGNLTPTLISKVSTDQRLQASESMKNQMIPVLQTLNKALDEKNVFRLLEAYTLESPFYRQLNQRLASEANIHWSIDLLMEESDDASTILLKAQKWQWHKIFAFSIIGNELLLEPHKQYKGTVYRGMRCDLSDIEQYHKGECIINMAFLSTSKDEEMAAGFAPSSDDGKQSVLCTYILNKSSFAIDIESISKFSTEKEVLIMPHNIFEVKNIGKKNNMITIELNSVLGVLESFTPCQKCSLCMSIICCCCC